MLKLRARIRLDDAVEDARPVVDDDHQDVAALLARARQRSAAAAWLGRRGPAGGPSVGCRSFARAPPHVSMRSDRPLPAGIIGKTFCSSAISNQTSAGPSTAWADRIASSTSSGVARLEGRDAVGLGELQVVGPEQAAPSGSCRRRSSPATGGSCPSFLLSMSAILTGMWSWTSGHQLLAASSGSRRRRRSPRSPCRAGRAPRPSPPGTPKPMVPEAAGADVRVRPPEARVPGQPHLVLADVGDELRVVVRELADALDDVVGGQQRRRATRPSRASSSPPTRGATRPARRSSRSRSSAVDSRDERRQRRAGRARRRPRWAPRPPRSCRSRPGRCRRG